MVSDFLERLPSFADPIAGEDDPAVALEPEQGPPPPAPNSPATLLSEDQEKQLAVEIREMLDSYDDVMKERWERERLIEDCYHLVPQKEWGGQYEGASELTSETVMAAVDQAHARLTGQLLSVEPMISFEGIESILPAEDSTKIAETLQTWMERFLRSEIRIDRFVPVMMMPTVMHGTAIIYAWWSEARREMLWDVIQSRDAVVWPPWHDDWQEAEFAGHRTLLTVSEFRRFALELGLEQEDVEALASEPESRPEEAEDTFARMEAEKIKPDNMTSLDKRAIVNVYELWANIVLPGNKLPTKLRLFYHRDREKILWVQQNEQRSRRHPYHPIRYKRTGMSSWGVGVGHEMLPFQAQDTVYMNLETDTLLSSCFGVYFVNRNSIANAMFEVPTPGQVIPTEDPKGDFHHESLANSEPLQMLAIARNSNEQRKRNASGMAAVLAGQGDPTQKSGTGTGSTLALIEEAGKKFGQIDRNVRNDLTELCVHTLEVAAQYSQGEVFGQHLPAEEAVYLVEFLQNVPEGKPLHKLLRVSVDAPSAQNNEELRRDRLLVVYNMLLSHADAMIQKYASPVLQAVNPAAIIAYVAAWADLIGAIGEKVLEAQEVPGVKHKVPDLKEFLGENPQQQQMNILIERLRQAEAVVQQLAEQASPGGPPGSRADVPSRGDAANSEPGSPGGAP